MKSEQVIKILKEAKISITNNRMMILMCLNDHIKHYHTISEIVFHIEQKTKEKVNIASIYNNIEKFLKAKIIDAFVCNNQLVYSLKDSILHNKNNIIHIISSQTNDAKHVEIDTIIFENIKQNVQVAGYKKINEIRIFVDVDE